MRKLLASFFRGHGVVFMVMANIPGIRRSKK